MFISGKQIPPSRKIYIGLTAIKGIGIRKAKMICKLYNIAPKLMIYQLTELQEDKISNYIENNFIIEEAVNKTMSDNIIKYIQNNSRRGFRHRHGLPVRGQRTHSNGQTQKRRKFHYTQTKKRD
jgi:small subunit ribosomal protein S13